MGLYNTYAGEKGWVGMLVYGRLRVCRLQLDVWVVNTIGVCEWWCATLCANGSSWLGSCKWKIKELELQLDEGA